MIKITSSKLAKKNSKLVIFAFVMTVIFQITAYKFIWGIEWVSRLLNIATIVTFSGYAFNALGKFKFNANVVNFYIIPGILVYIGFFINISINSISNLNVINQYGLVIPWAVYLAIPALVKFGNLEISSLWRYFNYFMLVTTSISIVEYYLSFSGFIALHPIVTDGGSFLAGYFSMLYATETGELHYRFYASFMEPGTLAMFLLPAMAYAFLHRNYISLIVYFIAMVMSDSLGGFIGLAMLIPLLIYFRFKKMRLFSVALSCFSIILMITFFAADFFGQYEEKGVSREDREVNTLYVVKNLPSLMLDYPLGLPLAESTEQLQKNTHYSGSNFTPGNAFNLGGILSFLGYLTILFVSLCYAVFSLFRKGLSLDEQGAVVSIFCLIPFIFQRAVVWDTSVFALLFAPFVIDFLQGVNKTYSITQ
jgi:hypothetical protein